ncbi:MAG: hypothetical protein HY429_03075 [Candidatus Levybacteria bacterium]|nr:hypothetical protein [Candidatus Levybacteria bacterium]
MELSNKELLLDISVNLARVSDWILSEKKQKLVDRFLEGTEQFLKSLQHAHVSIRFKPTLERFSKEFEKLLKDRNQKDREEWAERALTWANILQHRAKLA